MRPGTPSARPRGCCGSLVHAGEHDKFFDTGKKKSKFKVGGRQRQCLKGGRSVRDLPEAVVRVLVWQCRVRTFPVVSSEPPE